MTAFAFGLALGLLLNRQSKKPLLRFPLRCWFLGHSPMDFGDYKCPRCYLIRDEYSGRMESTFWTT